jgi:hypothetical protein
MMTQELLSDEEKASLRSLRSKYQTEYIEFEDGDEKVLKFTGKFIERTSEKYGTDQVVFDVVDPDNEGASHKLTMSSKRAIRAISGYLLEGENQLHLKKTGSGNATKWFVQAV